MLWLASAVSLLWLWLTWHDLRAVRTLPELPPLPPGTPRRAVTAVVALRDDGLRLAGSLQTLMDQRQVDLSIVAVDDRSSDDTADLLAGMAAIDDRIHVRTVQELPPDWLGKSHALHLGASDVDTRWLLFTDGDARLSNDAVARAIDAAEREHAQHVSLLPTHRHTTFWGRVCLLAFQLSVQRRVFAVNRDRPRSFVGTGAFNLVRTDAYREIGGHEPLRLEVVDDVWLGYLLQRGGFRSRVWLATRDFSIDWGSTPRELVRVVEKNMFAVLRYRTPIAVAIVAISLLLVFGSLCAPLWAGSVGWLTVGAYLSTGIAAAVLARRSGWSVAAGLLSPFGRLLLPLALANSTLRTLRRGGVRWRDTFYPLATLRRGCLPMR